MNQISTEEEQEEFHEEQDSLWRLALSPTLWALHFVICYGATTVFCADHILGVDYLSTLRLGIGLLTIAVLAAIVWLGWGAWRQWDVVRDREWENDAGNNEDRHQFMGHAAFLLSLISAVGVIYVSLPVLLIASCA